MVAQPTRNNPQRTLFSTPASAGKANGMAPPSLFSASGAGSDDEGLFREVSSRHGSDAGAALPDPDDGMFDDDDLFEALVEQELAAQMAGGWEEAAAAGPRPDEGAARARAAQLQARRLEGMATRTPSELRKESYSHTVKPDRFGAPQPGGRGTDVSVKNGAGQTVRLWIPETCTPGQAIAVDVVRTLSTGEVREVAQTIDGEAWTVTQLCTHPHEQREPEPLPEPEPEPEMPEMLPATPAAPTLDEDDPEAMEAHRVAESERKKRLEKERESAKKHPSPPQSPAQKMASDSLSELKEAAAAVAAAQAAAAAEAAPADARPEAEILKDRVAQLEATLRTVSDEKAKERAENEATRQQLDQMRGLALAVFDALDDDETELLELEELDDLVAKGLIVNDPAAMASLTQHIEANEGIVVEDFEDWWSGYPDDATALFGQLMESIKAEWAAKDQVALDDAALGMVEEGGSLAIYLASGKKKHDRYFWCSPKERTISWFKEKTTKAPTFGKGPKTMKLVSVHGTPHIKTARQWFDSIDSSAGSSDHKLDADEIATVYREARGETLKSKALATAMAEMDTDGGGAVEFHEFEKWWHENGGDLEKHRDLALTVTCGDGTADGDIHLILVAPGAATKQSWLAGLGAMLRLSTRRQTLSPKFAQPKSSVDPDRAQVREQAVGPPEPPPSPPSPLKVEDEPEPEVERLPESAYAPKPVATKVVKPKPGPEPAKEPAAPSPAVSSPAAAAENDSPTIANLCRRKDLNYPTPDEVKAALAKAMPKNDSVHATAILRKSASQRPERKPYDDTKEKAEPQPKPQSKLAGASSATTTAKKPAEQAEQDLVLRWVNNRKNKGLVSRAVYDRLAFQAYEEDWEGPLPDEDWEDLCEALGADKRKGLTGAQLVAGIERDELTFPAGPDEYDEILEAIGKLD